MNDRLFITLIQRIKNDVDVFRLFQSKHIYDIRSSNQKHNVLTELR